MAYGRTFLQRRINLIRSSQLRQKFIRLNKQARLDLQWWYLFLPSWNGISFFDLPEWAPVPDFEISTDASGSKDFGGYYHNQWFSAAWLPTQELLGMAYKELYPIVVSCHLWGHHWRRVTSEYSSIVTIKVSCTFLKPARPRTMLSWI